MGRLKTLMSHTRNMHMEMNEKFIKYDMPLYLEKDMLGNLCNVEIKSDSIVLSFHNKTPKPPTEVRSCCSPQPIPATINGHLATFTVDKKPDFSLIFD